MEKNRPLLSICIPTYNRAEILKKTIDTLLSLEEFNSEVELVISDNASEDGTESLIKELIHKYEDKRILYHRNNSNIKDLNFFTVLSVASGKYLKLFNDYTYINNDILAIIKKCILEHESQNINLLFYDHLRVKKLSSGECIVVESLDEFQRCVNNKITWISNFGCWREDLPELDKYNGASTSQLLQMEWTLHLVNKRRQTKLVNVSYYCFQLEQGKRTPYNFFVPHVENYYTILYNYKAKGYIGNKTIHFDKRRILSDFVGDKIVEYLILRNSSDFIFEGSWKLILRHFFNIPYFYIVVSKGFYKKIKYKLRDFVK